MFKAWLDDEATAAAFFCYAEQYDYRWSDGKKVTAGDFRTRMTPLFVTVRNGVLRWGKTREEFDAVNLPGVNDLICESLSYPARLEQLAEECSEAAKEALKLARIIRGENPTPSALHHTETRLESEVADIMNALSVLDIPTEGDPGKMFRWAMRLD